MLEFLSQNWFVDTIFVTLAMGLVAFINKVFAERKYNQKFSSIILWGIFTVFALVYATFSGFKHIGINDILLLCVWGVGAYLYVIIMMTALLYLPTSTYFISVRLMSSIVLLFIGIIFFSDTISVLEWAGFIVGIGAMILLFERENNNNVNYRKGVVWLLLGVVTLIGTHLIAKIFSVGSVETPMILLAMSSSSFLVALIFGISTLKKFKKDFFPIFKINFIQAVLFFYYFIVLLKVYDSGDLGISYKIQSYSPFIPIILSAIVYKEKISIKKKIALVLVAISLWFFKG